jgi:peptide deformylase
MIRGTKRVLFPLNIETKYDIEKMINTLSRIPDVMSLAANEIGIDKHIIVYRKFQNEK